VTPKTCILGVLALKKLSRPTVLIFGYIEERTNTKILSSHFLQFPF